MCPSIESNLDGVPWYCSYLAFESVAATAEAGRAEGDIGPYSNFAADWEALDEVKTTRSVLAKHKAAAEKAAKKK